VRLIESGLLSSDVRVLYVPASQDATLTHLAPSFHTAGLLTVGESDLFVRSGGIIRLLVESDRLQFEIDADIAEKVGLTLSSQLLMLARKVRSSR
jgi:hypothetical protein